MGEIWFVLIGVLLAGYAVLDGFDLGVGILYPFLGRSESDRWVLRRAIGPVWDGNEVWLLTGGGALFAAFPPVYATVFSGFYMAFMLLLLALIFRALALEFRHHDPEWAGVWDWAFSASSLVPAVLFGIAVGNIVRGLPLTEEGEFIAGGGTPTFLGNLLSSINLYALLIGVLGVVWIVLQGSAWLSLKTVGDLYERAKRTRRRLSITFAVTFVLASVGTWLLVPAAFENATDTVLGWLFVVAVVVGTVLAAVDAGDRSDVRAFLGSSLAALGMVGLWAASIYPALVPSRGAGEPLTIANSASSNLTLSVMLAIAVIGMPLVIYYFFLVYRTYAGRIAAEPTGAEMDY